MAESNGHDKLARDVEHNNRKIYALKAQIKEQAELVVDAHSRLEARKATISLVRAINDMTLVSFNNHMEAVANSMLLVAVRDCLRVIDDILRNPRPHEEAKSVNYWHSAATKIMAIVERDLNAHPDISASLNAETFDKASYTRMISSAIAEAESGTREKVEEE